MVKLGELSIFRTELMGISALLILICHLYGYVDLSVTVQYILSLGNILSKGLLFLLLNNIKLFKFVNADNLF